MQKPSRKLWIAAILVSVACVGALAYGLVTDWDAEPGKQTLPVSASPRGSGFGLGLLVGIGAGIVIGSLIALRRRDER